MSGAKNKDCYIQRVEEVNEYIEDLLETCDTTDRISEIFSEHWRSEEKNE